WGRRDQVKREFALEALLDDLHMEKAEEAAAEAEAQGNRALRLVGKAPVIEVQPLDRLAQERVVITAERIDPGKDEALGFLVAGQGRARRCLRVRQRVTDLRIADALQAGRNVPDLTGGECLDGHQLRPEDA